MAQLVRVVEVRVDIYVLSDVREDSILHMRKDLTPAVADCKSGLNIACTQAGDLKRV